MFVGTWQGYWWWDNNVPGVEFHAYIINPSQKATSVQCDSVSYTATKAADDLSAKKFFINVASPVENGDNVIRIKKPFTITCAGTAAEC